MNLSPAYLRWLYLRGALWWLGLAQVGVGTVLLLIAFTLWRGEQGFEANAQPATARVTGKETRVVRSGQQGKTPRTAHVLAYTFQDAAGQQHAGKAEVSAQAWAEAKKGDNLSIAYDRTNPASSRLAGGDTSARWGIGATAGIGALFATFGLLTTACLLIRSGQRARLIRTGRPALGVVDGVVENDSALKVAGTYRVCYRFTDEAGEAREGRGPPQPWSLAGRWNRGDTVLVLYDPRHPGRHEADLFEARSEELAELQDQAGEDAGAD